MQSVAGSRIIWLGILVSALVTGIPAQFGWVATAGTIRTADIFSQPGQGSNDINGPLSPELPRQSSTRPSRRQPVLELGEQFVMQLQFALPSGAVYVGDAGVLVGAEFQPLPVDRKSTRLN